MKANELRIGNIIHYNGNKKEIGVISKIAKSVVPNIDYVGIDGRQDINYQCKHIKPIPLTEEWLKKFGFFIVETNKCVDAFKENFRYSIQQVDNSNQWFWCDGETVITNLEFIHQLQNLYFTLTNKELKLTKN